MTMLNVENMTVAGRLRVARLAVGRDQSEMAMLLGVSRNTVSSWERGITEPNVSQFIAWARETKQPVDQLIDGLPGVRPLGLEPRTHWLRVEATDIEAEIAFWAIVEPVTEVRTRVR